MMYMDKDELIDSMEDHECLLADGFDNAIIGISSGFNPIAVYDYGKCVEILMERDQMSSEDAIEFMNFNVTGAYVGEKTPMFVHLPYCCDKE